MLYIFSGPNAFNKEIAVHKLRKSVGTEFESLYADQGLQPWFDRLGQSDLFGHEVSLIGRDQLDQWSAGQLGQMWAHLEKQLVFDEKGPVVVLLGQKSEVKTLPELSDGQQKQVVRQHFETLTEAQLQRWVRSMASSMDLTIKPSLIASMLERLSGNQFAILNQLRRWQLERKKDISDEDVLAIVSIGQSGEIFNFLDMWSNRKLKACLVEYDMLVRHTTDISQITSMLAWQIELLRYCLLAREEGLSGASVAKGTSFKSYSLTRADRAAKLWSLADLDMAIHGLTEVDALSKSGGRDGVLALELWIYRSLGAEG